MKAATLWLLLLAGAALSPTAAASAGAFDPEHRAWTRLLAAHLHDGRVDYAALRRDRTALDAYVQALAAVDAAALAALPRADRLAYWLNAYNAFVVTTVVDHYPIRGRTLRGLARPANSIWQIPGAFDGKRFRAGGRRVSLDDVEHAIVRPTFADPRVHVALVCAARSCPPLRGEAYVGSRLDVQLDEQSRRFVADRVHGVRVDPTRSRVSVSSIFEWFGEDFAALGGGDEQRGVLEFVARHAADAAFARQLRSGELALGYLPYDWSLNDR